MLEPLRAQPVFDGRLSVEDLPLEFEQRTGEGGDENESAEYSPRVFSTTPIESWFAVAA